MNTLTFIRKAIGRSSLRTGSNVEAVGEGLETGFGAKCRPE